MPWFIGVSCTKIVVKSKHAYFLNYLVGAIAIDDIQAIHGRCPQSDPNVFRCTFEGRHNCSFTPIYNPKNFRLFWEIYQGSDTHIKAIDHTLKTDLGHYYALDFYNLEKADYSTTSNYKIVSKYFPPTRQTCVTFSYYMTGQQNNESLNFYLMKEDSLTGYQLWKANGDLGPFWYSHRMTIDSAIRWQVGFDVTTNDSDHGLIAFDDITVEMDKPCPPKGKCDFEVKTVIRISCVLFLIIALGKLASRHLYLGKHCANTQCKN